METVESVAGWLGRGLVSVTDDKHHHSVHTEVTHEPAGRTLEKHLGLLVSPDTLGPPVPRPVGGWQPSVTPSLGIDLGRGQPASQERDLQDDCSLRPRSVPTRAGGWRTQPCLLASVWDTSSVGVPCRIGHDIAAQLVFLLHLLTSLVHRGVLTPRNRKSPFLP